MLTIFYPNYSERQSSANSVNPDENAHITPKYMATSGQLLTIFQAGLSDYLVKCLKCSIGMENCKTDPAEGAF